MMSISGPPRGKLLDVGCGNGSFLAFMKSLGWDVEGVEPDPKAAEIARSSLQVKVLASSLESAQFPSEHFEAVTLAHVLEHVHDPIALLKECRRVLKPGGTIVVRTPNLSSLGYRFFRGSWVGLETPRHLFLFNPHTLKACAEKASLSTLAVRTTAQFAFLLWEGSRLASRDKSWAESKISWPLAFAGLAFQIVEYSATLLGKEVGEEVVLIATKQPVAATL
jgi:2-polyprenyl-3-methyl-5-hydroxy-6-metoxy-1,4-benzoquinol methylase